MPYLLIVSKVRSFTAAKSKFDGLMVSLVGFIIADVDGRLYSTKFLSLNWPELNVFIGVATIVGAVEGDMCFLICEPLGRDTRTGLNVGVDMLEGSSLYKNISCEFQNVE